jgi:hypothetical protein
MLKEHEYLLKIYNMPWNIFSRQQFRLIQRWFKPEDARRIAYQTQVKNGNVTPWTYQLTDKGKRYSELEPRQRSIMRYAKNRNLRYDDVQYLDWRAIKKKPKLR